MVDPMRKPVASPFDWTSHTEQQNLLRGLIQALLKKNENYNIEYWQEEGIRRTISAYPADLIQKIHEYVGTDEIKRGTGFRINSVRLLVVSKATPERINEGLYFLPQMDRVTEIMAESMLNALHCYQQLPESLDYSREEPSIVAQCTALIRVTCSLFHLYNLEEFDLDPLDIRDLLNVDSTIADERLTELVLSRPEHADQIGQVILSRKCVNADLIKETLAIDVPALSTGTL